MSVRSKNIEALKIKVNIPILHYSGWYDRYPHAAVKHFNGINKLGGEKARGALAKLLLRPSNLLVLDEPTAGMGPEDSERIREFLAGLKGTYSMLLIEHDMDTVFALADRITVLVYGKTIATGTPSEIRDNDAVRAAYLGEDEAVGA